jgi:L-lactate utilization protein LutB
MMILLIIRCAACKNKLWKYDKIGKGKVLRCHKDRIIQFYSEKIIENDKYKCSCGKAIGIDKGTFIKMDPKAFVYSGTKRNK